MDRRPDYKDFLTVCNDSCCGYPHPHCSRCGEPLFWDADHCGWHHVNGCALIPGWQTHSPRILRVSACH